MRKSLWTGLALLALTVLAGSMIYAERQAKSIAAAARVEKDILEHLPIGTPRREVEQYLDQKRIPHSYTDGSNAFPEYQHTEAAMISGTSRTWLVRGDTQILFKFDSQDAVSDYTVREIFTGP